jgi:hypothetical protein
VTAPELSIIVVFHNMRREAARTLYTLSAAYQRGVASDRYEVIAVDNGSSEPLDRVLVEGFGDNFHYRFHATDNPSPVACINEQVRNCRGRAVMVMIDGAHMLTPGVIGAALRLFRAYADPFVTVVGFHLGPGIQNQTVSRGYDQQAEDRLLAGIDWRANGYELFRIGQGLSYDCAGWFGPLMESNCFFLGRERFLGLGGFDERFREPGGGLAILDLFQTLVGDPEQDYLVLLGEGSFHQFHGGVASNAPYEEHPWQRFHVEYERLKGQPFAMVIRRPVLFGAIPPEAVVWTRLCARIGLEWWEQRDRHGDEISPDTFGYALQAAREAEAGREATSAELRQQLNTVRHAHDQLALQLAQCRAELARRPVKNGWLRRLLAGEPVDKGAE